MSDSCLDKKEKTNSVLLTSQEDPFANKQEKEEAYSCSITNSSQPSAEVGGKPDLWSKESGDSSNAGNKNDMWIALSTWACESHFLEGSIPLGLNYHQQSSKEQSFHAARVRM